MQKRNCKRDYEEGAGTVLIIKDLEKVNTEKSFIELTHFLQGLYSEKCIMKGLNGNYLIGQTLKHVLVTADVPILPNNLMFGCKAWIDKQIYVYDEDGKLSFQDKKIRNKHEKYAFN